MLRFVAVPIFLLEDGEHEDLRPGGGGQPGAGAAAGVQLHPHPHLGQPLLTPHAHQAGSQVLHLYTL
jgi:hypothetical protein